MGFDNLRELYRYKELLWVWMMREISIRYKQSVLGALWAIIQPLSSMIIVSVIFGYFVKVPTDGAPYPIFFYSALLPWTFFSTSITFAVPSLINNLNLVTKIYFPREIFPIASIGAAFLDFLVASILFLALIILYRLPFNFMYIWLPLLIIIQILFTLGISFFASSIIVFYRDIRFIVPIGLQLWMYLSPVVYPVSTVPSKFQTIYMLNPMASIIDSYRRIILHGQPPQWNYLALGGIITFIIVILGYLSFKKHEPSFADII